MPPQKGICDNGSVYEGDHVDMVPHGTGIITLPNGTRFEGEFKEGKYHAELGHARDALGLCGKFPERVGNVRLAESADLKGK